MKKDSPINACIKFKNGKKRIFYGNKFEKEDIGMMVLLLRKMVLKSLHEIEDVKFYDNTIQSGNKLFFHYKSDCIQPVLLNNMINYLGHNFNPTI